MTNAVIDTIADEVVIIAHALNLLLDVVIEWFIDNFKKAQKGS